MKALVKTELGFGNLRIQERAIPTPEKDQVKIEVKYAGICGSDIHTYEGHYKVKTPVTLGHEFSGKIVEVGEGVTKYKIGDRVTSETTFYICDECNYCKKKDYNLCDYRKGLGTHQDGSYAKYIIARKDSLHHLPKNVDYQAAAMTEPLACVYHAVSKTEINDNDIVVVIGPGPIGLLTAQVVKSLGAKVIITGLSHDKVRLDKAKELGVDYVVNIEEKNTKDLIKHLTNGYGAHVVFECSGSVPGANQGLDLLQKKGQFVQVGIFADPIISFDMSKVIQKEIQIIGSRSQKPDDWEPSLKLMNNRSVNVATLVTHEFDITQWDKAYEVIKNGEAIKVLLTPVE